MSILHILAAHLQEQGYTAELWTDIPKGYGTDHIKITTPRHPKFHITAILRDQTTLALHIGWSSANHSKATTVDLADPRSLDILDKITNNYLPLPHK